MHSTYVAMALSLSSCETVSLLPLYSLILFALLFIPSHYTILCVWRLV